ncbi:MAG: PQQ-dependent sugar dehydrogenase [Flavobacteriales bacterium]|nr:PQQ-dependent sugar dehydrogenase [Flavobacteriales bacterium]
MLRRIPGWLGLVPLIAGSWALPQAQAQTVPSGFTDAVVVSGFSEPVGFTFDAYDRLYVWEKQGKVWIVENGVRLPNPLIDISEEVGNWRDHGCLGFTLDPDFLSNGYIYLFYTVDRYYLLNHGLPSYDPAADQYFNATIMRVTRYTAEAPDFNSVNMASRKVLIGETKQTGIPLLYESHSTGSLVFGSDGTLMLTAGDGASYNVADVGSQPQTYFAQALADSILRPEENVGAMRAQMVNSMSGKMLRIDPATGNGVASNPFYDPSAPRSAASRVWALGLRNPYRFTRRPGTGSTDPAAGDPGVFYIGDVGWSSYEEMNVCYTGGMNFGWPIFEGMGENGSYLANKTQNLEAPNPLFGQGGCTKPYFDFQDLIVQETLTHPVGLPNPCNPSVLIPPNIHTFTNDRPVIDWVHGNQSRCSAFNGNSAVAFDLDDPASPVPGPRFGGNASVGGSFIAGTGWPAGYQGSYFQGDYGGAWIRRVVMTPDDKAVEVFNFATNMGAVVFIKEGPDGALWYVRYETGQIRKVSPLGFTNLPPVAVAEQDALFGPGPLTVQFTGSNSTDPEQGVLTYFWDFGDGNTSTSANPSHVFTAPPGVPTVYTVTLTVRDDQNQPNSTTLIVNVNNTPPVVAITSFPDGQLYPVGIDTTFALEAAVSDAEHGPAQLSYAWQTILHHNNHVHPEPVDHAVTSSTVISGVGCYSEDFHYEQVLTVTDAGGLSTTVVHQLYPDCARIPPTAVITASSSQGLLPLVSTLDGSNSVDNGTVVSYDWDFGDGTFASGEVVPKTFSETGDYYVTLTVTDNDGLSSSSTKVFTVYTTDPPQCVGPMGSVLREYWTGISGSTVSALINSPNYPDSPSGSTYPTSIQGPVNFANNYGTRMRGYIIPPTTGAYTFNATSDDASIFYLSLNADPALKTAICEVPGFTNPDDYTKYPGQQSGTIMLTAGRYYYFEFLQKEGSGGDHMAIRWTRPGNSTLTVVDGAYLARWVDCSPTIKVRMVLDGPYDPSTGLMKDDLRANGFIPLQEPYTALGFTQAGGGGGETVDQAMLNITGKNAIVDWVLVELRSGSNASNIVATQAALLQRDGDAVGVDGRTSLIFNVPEGSYYVAVRHRNHLGVIQGQQVQMNKYTSILDLAKKPTPIYGTDAVKEVSDGKMALWAGNAVRDGQLKYTGTNNDRDALLLQIGSTVPTAAIWGYHVEDLNMDGAIRYTGARNDRDKLLQNLGGIDPVATRPEQLP